MRNEDIRAAVQAAIASIAPEAAMARIRADLPLREQADLDSMDWLNVVVALGEAFGIDIPERDYGQLASLDSIVAYVAARQAKERPAPAPALAAASAEPPAATFTLRGVPVTVRPMHHEDQPLEAAFVRHLSSDARYNRFMLSLRELSKAKLAYLTDVDQVGHVALLATVERDGKAIEVAVARYIVDAAGRSCEFAIAVDDEWQGTGLAGILMRSLMDVARSRGLSTMEGIVLAANHRMLKFARQLGFRQERDPGDRQTLRIVRSL